MTGEATGSISYSLGLIISGICQVITWAIVVAGWFFVDRRNNRRETRKETWARICDIINLVNNVTEMGVEYHTTDVPTPELAKKIKYNLHRLSRDLSLVSKKIRVGTNYIREFRRSITLENFDSMTFIQYSQYNAFIEKIRMTGDDLSNQLEELFNTVYSD